MPNEQQQEQPIPQVDNQDEVFVEPQDLSQAFGTLREIKQMPAEDSVESAAEPEPAAGQQPEPEQQYIPQQQEPAPVYDGTGAEPDGYADNFGSTDYSSIAKELIDDITKAAAEETTKTFRDNGIEKFSVNMLYRKDEQTGRAVFENPDNPDMPFATRQEAQAWCDAINKDIDIEWRKQATQRRSELMKSTVPSLNMLAFAPTFYAMSDAEQEAFDFLVEEHAIKGRDEQGEEIILGYNCDLNSYAEKAKRMVANGFGAKQYNTTQQPYYRSQPTGPAVDMKSSSSNAQPTQEITDPKDLSEAMKMLKQHK